MRGNHYQMQNRVDHSQYYYAAAVVLMVLLIGLVGQCEYLDAPITPLTQEQRAEIMSRQTAQEREDHIDMASRILAGRVEKEWRESK